MEKKANRERSIVRRGSEGYEVRPVNREEILRRYIEDQGQEMGRYQTYVPEPESEGSEDLDDPEDDSETFSRVQQDVETLRAERGLKNDFY